jgi:class 3 adenylate cyclase
MISKVELVAMSRGTLLLHRLVVEPRGMMGRAAVELELRLNTRRNLGRVYRRIDDYLTGQQRRPVAGGGGTSVMDAAALLDPFEAPRKPSEPQRLRIERGRDALARHGVAGHVADALCDYLAAAPDAEVGRIRPRAFARRLRFDEREVLRACLRGVSEGLLLLLWDVICPRCQVPASVEQSLENLREHQHCEACDIGYDADFGRSVEVVFRVHPEVRDSEMGTYCIGGPGHTPHVLAQVRLAPGERFELELTLDEGQYYVSGKQLPSSYGFRVSPNGSLRAWELSLGTDPPASTKRVMAMGHQRVVLSNDHDVEIVARVERSSARDDAMTAAEVVTSRLFRELFPGENLEQGQLVSVNRVALLLVELSDAWRDDDEAAAFARLNELTLKVDEVVSERGGAVVKIHGDGILTAFHDTGAATEAALDLLVGVGDLPARLALHGGATMVTSINDRLDYFGRVVRQVASLLALGERGELVLGEPIYADPGAAVLLASTSASRRIVVGDGVVGQALRCDDAATAELEPTPVMS